LGKYCAVTEGVVEVRNLSRFPASCTDPVPAAATFTSTAVVVVVVAMDATDGFEDVVDEESSESTRLSTSVCAAPAGGGGFCLADRGDGDGDSEGDADRCCCCWRRTCGGL
jgi:hypothetical protein